MFIFLFLCIISLDLETEVGSSVLIVLLWACPGGKGRESVLLPL